MVKGLKSSAVFSPRTVWTVVAIVSSCQLVGACACLSASGSRHRRLLREAKANDPPYRGRTSCSHTSSRRQPTHQRQPEPWTPSGGWRAAWLPTPGGRDATVLLQLRQTRYTCLSLTRWMSRRTHFPGAVRRPLHVDRCACGVGCNDGGGGDGGGGGGDDGYGDG